MSAYHSSFLTAKQPRAIKSVLQAGLIAGFLAAAAAIILFFNTTGKNPIIIFNYVASGLIGPSAFTGGVPIAFLGLLLHFIIAVAFALLFFLIYPQIKRLKINPFVSGIFYGTLVWFIMNFVVLRLSQIPNVPLSIIDCFTELLLLIIFLGVPISLTVDKHYEQLM